VNQRIATNGLVTSTTSPVTISWSASDQSGIAAYAVYVKTDGRQYQYESSISATATQYTYALQFGHSYEVAVAAKDGAGNWSSYSYTGTIAPSIVDDTAFTVNSPWTRYNLTGTFGGSYIATASAGAYVQKTFTGREAALVAPKFSTAGRATVYCDGISIGLVDLYSASTAPGQAVASCRFSQSGQHTIKVVNEGTSGRPWLGFDAFAILS
jgi:hypothetical protein